MPSEITWSAPAATPPLSEDEIKDIRQTLHLLHDLLRKSTTPKNHTDEEEDVPREDNTNDDDDDDDDDDTEELLQITTTLTAAGSGEQSRKRDKARRILQTHGPRILGAATAIGLGVLNLVTSMT